MTGLSTAPGFCASPAVIKQQTINAGRKNMEKFFISGIGASA
jgi:hypothetical protein